MRASEGDALDRPVIKTCDGSLQAHE